jgi:hypothetical protein
VLEGLGEVDAAIARAVCHSFEDFCVEAGAGVVEEQFFVEGDGGEEVFLEVQVVGLGEHALRSIYIKW